jgi:hypothetical protein
MCSSIIECTPGNERLKRGMLGTHAKKIRYLWYVAGLREVSRGAVFDLSLICTLNDCFRG